MWYRPTPEAPRQRQDSIEQQEADHRWQDTQETTAVKLAHRHAFFHWHKQKGRDDHKQWNGYAPETAIIEGNPETITLVRQQ